MGRCHRLPVRSPMAMILLSRKIVTFLESKVTVQPVSTIGAIPPRACCKPGTMCAGRDKDGASLVVPEEVECRVVPSGWMMGDVKAGVLLSDDIKWVWEGG